jgi:purine nucleoside phosphorylase
VAGEAVSLVLTVADPACRSAGDALFPGARLLELTREQLRPPAPFEGPLFALLAERPRGALVGLVVSVRAAGDEGARPAPGALVPVADHVGLEGRGPLTGRWPAGVPRDFPSMTGIYQPAYVRPRHGARVYSSGVVAAGVADVRRLSRFEARAVREGGWPIVSDTLVPVAVVAAYYGVKLAACGVVQAPRSERE